MKETDLYLPVKVLFEALGYSVTGEVNGIDVVAIKDEELIVIELKSSFNLKLIHQAVDRQRLTPDVYVAIPRPVNKKKHGKDFNDKEHLLRRLELGLIFVSMDVKEPYAQIVFDPKPFHSTLSLSKGKKRKSLLLKELSERHGDYTAGGTRGKVVTAYREKALIAVAYLKDQGEMTVKDLRAATGNEKVQSLLSNNHYHWFDRVKPGCYQLTSEGISAFDNYQDIIQKIK